MEAISAGARILFFSRSAVGVDLDLDRSGLSLIAGVMPLRRAVNVVDEVRDPVFLANALLPPFGQRSRVARMRRSRVVVEKVRLWQPPKLPPRGKRHIPAARHPTEET